MARHRDPPPTKALRSPICGNVGNGTRFGTIRGFKKSLPVRSRRRFVITRNDRGFLAQLLQEAQSLRVPGGFIVGGYGPKLFGGRVCRHVQFIVLSAVEIPVYIRYSH